MRILLELERYDSRSRAESLDLPDVRTPAGMTKPKLT